MHRTKILYVEDEPFLAKIVRETLESKGFDVKHIDHGQEALAAFQDMSPDICILDVMLPGKDGFGIGKEIRTINPKTPIIYLTAKDQTKDLLKGFASGGNDYIKKPFSMEELIARIDNLLMLSNGKEMAAKDQVEFKIGSFVLNTVKMQLSNGDQKIKLSHRENEILKMLASKLNGQVHRKDILMKIWGDDSFFNSRNLDVYIRKLRKYLSSDLSIQLITLKGIGYRLAVEEF